MQLAKNKIQLKITKKCQMKKRSENSLIDMMKIKME